MSQDLHSLPLLPGFDKDMFLLKCQGKMLRKQNLKQMIEIQMKVLDSMVEEMKAAVLDIWGCVDRYLPDIDKKLFFLSVSGWLEFW